MKLSKRMKKLLQMVGACNTQILDIGADHGILSKAILDENLSENVVATDISEKCLEKAQNALLEYLKIGRARCVVSDGLLKLTDIQVCDMVIIAGMGGNEMVKILSQNPKREVFNKFLLQPMQDAEILRDYLQNNGYQITEDEIIEEHGKFYSVIKTVFSGQNSSMDELAKYFGRFYKEDKSEDFKAFVRYTLKTLKSREKYLTKNDLLKLKFCENIVVE